VVTPGTQTATFSASVAPATAASAAPRMPSPNCSHVNRPARGSSPSALSRYHTICGFRRSVAYDSASSMAGGFRGLAAIPR
jgi:hypothetical protein